MSNCKYVTKTIVKIEKQDFVAASIKVSNKSKEIFKIGLNFSMVGTAKRNLIVQKGEGSWDIDYQVYVNDSFQNKFDEPYKMKDWFKTTFEEFLPKNYNISISTSSLEIRKTSINGDVIRSFDVAILRKNSDGKIDILRGKVPNYGRWENLGKLSENYVLGSKKIKGSEQWEFLRKVFIDKKCIELKKTNVDERKSSSSIFLEASNETNQHFNQ